MKEQNEKYEIPIVGIRLVKEAILYSKFKISSSNDVVNVLSEELSACDREEFWIVNLQSDGTVLNVNRISIGTLNSSLVSPREVFKGSILSNAAAIIAVHNHPSGNIGPSREDYKTTIGLLEAGNILDIPLIDHIIVAGRSSELFSFKGNDLLSKTVLDREIYR